MAGLIRNIGPKINQLLEIWDRAEGDTKPEVMGDTRTIQVRHRDVSEVVDIVKMQMSEFVHNEQSGEAQKGNNDVAKLMQAAQMLNGGKKSGGNSASTAGMKPTVVIGFDSKNIGYLKGALKGLMETVVEFDVLEEDGKRSWEAMVLLPYARIKDGTCTYRYERALAEKLYHPDVYSKINLSVLREMNSSHALVLYENCYRFEGIGHTAWWDIEVFRKLMAVDTMSSYKPFKALNRNVIQPAMKEVNKLSNIQVEMETRRKGRTVTGLRFIIRPNAQLSLVGMDSEDEITDRRTYKALMAEGVSKTSHYALATGFMALGMMLPGLISGFMQEWLGYDGFFIWVVIAALPAFILLKYIKYPPNFGKAKT
mgnify:CR=1 FL=1